MGFTATRACNYSEHAPHYDNSAAHWALFSVLPSQEAPGAASGGASRGSSVRLISSRRDKGWCQTLALPAPAGCARSLGTFMRHFDFAFPGIGAQNRAWACPRREQGGQLPSKAIHIKEIVPYGYPPSLNQVPGALGRQSINGWASGPYVKRGADNVSTYTVPSYQRARLALSWIWWIAKIIQMPLQILRSCRSPGWAWETPLTR